MGKTFTLKRSGERVTSRDGESPILYVNRTQAERAAAKVPGGEVIQRGRPFYVRVPEPAALLDPTGYVEE